MKDDVERLYKLMVMYMLNKVNFPLSNNQISNFMLGKQYTTYFTLQEALHSMEEDNFIHSILYHNSTQYVLTDKGRDTIKFFYNKISHSIREDIDTYLTENKYELKCEVETISDYYRSDKGDYIAHLCVTEGDTALIDLSLSVPLEEEAKIICSKWKTHNQDVYEYIVKQLM